AGRNRNWVAGSSSWCSTFPGNSTLSGCQPHVVTERCGVKGVARERRALARPHHRADARRSQDASHSALPGRTVSREWPGRDEHWLVRVIELVLDVPRNLDTLGGHDARHYRGVRCQGSDPGRTSISSSTPNTRQLPQPVKLNSSPSAPPLITAPGAKSPARRRWASGLSIQ